MRIVAFRKNGNPALGLRSGSEVIDLSDLGVPCTLDKLLAAGADGLQAASKTAQRSRQRTPLDAIEWLPPLQNPAKAIAVGFNYVDHAAESKFEVPAYPVQFNRYPSSWVVGRTPPATSIKTRK